eukprot:tig00000402_g180.t1
MQAVPDDVLSRVFSLLPQASRVVAARVCRRWRQAADEPAAWPDLQLWISEGGPHSHWAQTMRPDRRFNVWRHTTDPLREQLLDDKEAAPLLRQRRFSGVRRLVVMQVLGSGFAETLRAAPGSVRELEIYVRDVANCSGDGLNLAGAVLPPGVERLLLANTPEGGANVPAYVLAHDLIALAGGRRHGALRRIEFGQEHDCLELPEPPFEAEEAARGLAAAFPNLGTVNGELWTSGGPSLRVLAASRLAPRRLSVQLLATAEDFESAQEDIAALAARGCELVEIRKAEGPCVSRLLRGRGVPHLSAIALEACEGASDAGSLLSLLCGGEHSASLRALRVSCALVAASEEDPLAALARLPRLASLCLLPPLPPADDGLEPVVRAVSGLPRACPDLGFLELWGVGSPPAGGAWPPGLQALKRAAAEASRALDAGARAPGAPPRPPRLRPKPGPRPATGRWLPFEVSM